MPGGVPWVPGKCRQRFLSGEDSLCPFRGFLRTSYLFEIMLLLPPCTPKHFPSCSPLLCNFPGTITQELHRQFVQKHMQVQCNRLSSVPIVHRHSIAHPEAASRTFAYVASHRSAPCLNFLRHFPATNAASPWILHSVVSSA
jgi:hypothetical protein